MYQFCGRADPQRQECRVVNAVPSARARSQNTGPERQHASTLELYRSALAVAPNFNCICEAGWSTRRFKVAACLCCPRGGLCSRGPRQPWYHMAKPVRGSLVHQPSQGPGTTSDMGETQLRFLQSSAATTSPRFVSPESLFPGGMAAHIYRSSCTSLCIVQIQEVETIRTQRGRERHTLSPGMLNFHFDNPLPWKDPRTGLQTTVPPLWCKW